MEVNLINTEFNILRINFSIVTFKKIFSILNYLTLEQACDSVQS